MVLEVEDLRTHFFTRRGVVKAVDGLSFFVRKGECLGIIGESGSGKSVTGLSLLKLVDPPGRIVSGRVAFLGRDLMALPESEMQRLRGSAITMIFQDPLTSLNPCYRVGQQMVAILRRHKRKVTVRAALDRCVRALGRAGVPDAAGRISAYPFELSGGLRQRVLIAMSLLCKPSLVIADEPTTALDVSIQAQILDLLNTLKTEDRFSLVFISHDMGTIANIADRVMVMYAGRCAELAPVADVFERPLHPYTKALLSSIPGIERGERVPLKAIPGAPPNLSEEISGCAFRPRCGEAVEGVCDVCAPPLVSVADLDGRLCACYNVR